MLNFYLVSISLFSGLTCATQTLCALRVCYILSHSWLTDITKEKKKKREKKKFSYWNDRFFICVLVYSSLNSIDSVSGSYMFIFSFFFIALRTVIVYYVAIAQTTMVLINSEVWNLVLAHVSIVTKVLNCFSWLLVSQVQATDTQRHTKHYWIEQ